MFDIGWSELLIITVVTIIVVGPKDLPRLLRSVGQVARKVRETANEFRGHVDDVIRDAELDDLKSTMDDVKSMNPMHQVKKAITDEVDGIRDIVEDKDVRNYHEDFPDDEPYDDFDDPGAEWDDEDDVIVEETVSSEAKPPRKAAPRSGNDEKSVTSDASSETGPDVSWSDGESKADTKDGKGHGKSTKKTPSRDRARKAG